MNGEPVTPPTPEYRAVEREAVRLPIWASIGGSGVFSIAVDLLTEVPWRSAVVGVLAMIGPLLFGTEVARQRAWSPASVLTAAVSARRDGMVEGARRQRAHLREQATEATPAPPTEFVPGGVVDGPRRFPA